MILNQIIQVEQSEKNYAMNDIKLNKKTIVLSNLNHTWILDLDGTVVRHNGYKLQNEDTFLDGAKNFLKNIPREDMIIFITSRDENFRTVTEDFLQKNGVRYSHIIFNAPLGERILINDNKPSGLCMAHAICTERDTWCELNVVVDSSL